MGECILWMCWLLQQSWTCQTQLRVIHLVLYNCRFLLSWVCYYFLQLLTFSLCVKTNNVKLILYFYHMTFFGEFICNSYSRQISMQTRRLGWSVFGNHQLHVYPIPGMPKYMVLKGLAPLCMNQVTKQQLPEALPISQYSLSNL